MNEIWTERVMLGGDLIVLSNTINLRRTPNGEYMDSAGNTWGTKKVTGGYVWIRTQNPSSEDNPR